MTLILFVTSNERATDIRAFEIEKGAVREHATRLIDSHILLKCGTEGMKHVSPTIKAQRLVEIW